MKLTDAELFAAWHGTNSFAASLRAVQDAVLAKWEVETREREREAWDECVRFRGLFPDRVADFDNKRDQLFPSLHKPASVTLSTGTWTKVDDATYPWKINNGIGGYVAPQCATSADCDALKAYLQAMEEK